MRRLVESMEARLATVTTTDPVLRARRRLAETGRAYVEFAVAEPGLFGLAFSSASVVAGLAPPADRDPYGLLGRVLDELVEVGFLAVDDRPSAEITCWSGVHGFSVLSIDGALRESSPAERADALDRLLASIDRSYAATTATRIGPSDLRP